MREVGFNNEAKIEAFDKIAELFYGRNFGSASKAEIELLMFSIYIDEMIKQNVDEDGTLDYSNCSDYNIGKQLGIPQERVRSLKVKKQARYPISFDWKKSLQRIQNDIVYDDIKKKIIIPLRDPNLYNEIRNFIEDSGGYIEIQRGGNCIQMRPEYFFLLLYRGTESDTDKKKIRNNFVEQLRKRNETDNIDMIKTDDELEALAIAHREEIFDFLIDTVEGFSNPLIGILKHVKRLAGKKRK